MRTEGADYINPDELAAALHAVAPNRTLGETQSAAWRMGVARIERAIDRLGQRFIERIFTEAEAGYCVGRPSAAVHFAGRFAAKESAMKALGTGWGDGCSWRDVEILPGVGPPRLEFHGIALDRFRELGASRAFVSISHTGGMAVAQTIIEGD